MGNAQAETVVSKEGKEYSDGRERKYIKDQNQWHLQYH
jgi:hypothetical protein